MVRRTTCVADAVLSIVDMLSYDDALWAEPYKNGREHGWAVSNNWHSRKVAFSEYRNSDCIVVYFGTPADFDFAGNVPSDEVWKNAICFPYDDYYKAAQAIVDYLLLKDREVT